LLALAVRVEPSWSTLAAPLTTLTSFAVLPRYPGMSTGKTDAQSAVATCRRFRALARGGLGLRP